MLSLRTLMLGVQSLARAMKTADLTAFISVAANRASLPPGYAIVRLDDTSGLPVDILWKGAPGSGADTFLSASAIAPTKFNPGSIESDALGVGTVLSYIFPVAPGAGPKNLFIADRGLQMMPFAFQVEASSGNPSSVEIRNATQNTILGGMPTENTGLVYASSVSSINGEQIAEGDQVTITLTDATMEGILFFHAMITSVPPTP